MGGIGVALDRPARGARRGLPAGAAMGRDAPAVGMLEAAQVLAALGQQRVGRLDQAAMRSGVGAVARSA